MDIKDLIKWLFQNLKVPNVNILRTASEPRTVSKMCVIIIMAAVVGSCVNTCTANNVLSDISTIKSDNFKTNLHKQSSERGKVSSNSVTNETRPINLIGVKSFKFGTASASGSHIFKTKENEEKRISNITNVTQIDDYDEIKQIISENIQHMKLSTITSSLFEIIDNSLAYFDYSLNDKKETDTARTFGRPIRKLQAALLPIMFKLGVIATLIFMTFLLSLKAVGIGLLLLLFKVGGVIASLKSGLVHHGGHDFGHDEWSPQKEVHFHIHNSGHGHASAYYPSSSYHTSHSASEYDPWSRSDALPAALPAPASTQPAPYSLMSTYASQIAGPGSIDTPYGHYIRTGGPISSAYLG